MKALVVETCAKAVDNVSVCLHLTWPQVDLVHAEEAGHAITLVEEHSPDIVFLNLNLPDMDGFKALERIREFSDVPIIVLTEKTNEMDEAKSLEIGADDYIRIPFIPIDLMARVKAVLRRATMPQLREDRTVVFAADNLTVNFSTREVSVAGNQISLTPTEYNLLCNLVRNEGKVLSHRFLLEKTWGKDYAEDTASLKKYVYRLRLKIKDENNHQPMLLTQRGVGYKFVKPR